MISATDKLAFFTGAYLKINIDDLLLNDTKSIINITEKCINKAYQDVKRNIPYKFSTKRIAKLEIEERAEFIKLKRDFYNNVSKTIVEQVVRNGGVSIDKSDPISMIEKICKIGTDEKLFKTNKHITVGIAQKWVNMTLKYLWLLGVFGEEDEKLEVPIDQIIMEEIRKLGIQVPICKWSNWDSITEYNKLQDCLYENLLSNGYTRIAWENKYWVEGACKLK